MPLEWVVMRWAAQNQVVSGNLDRCIAVPEVIEVCRPQSRHSYKRGPAFQRGNAALAANRTDKTIRPAPLEHEGGTHRLVRERLLELGKPTSAGHRKASRRPRDYGHSRHNM